MILEMKLRSARAVPLMLASVFWLLTPLFGQGPAVTVVRDTVYKSDGSLASGSVVISWPPFITADNKTVFGGTKTISLNSGFLQVSLVPTVGSTPQGISYNVKYYQSGGVSFDETWVVPSSGTPVSLAQVRVSAAPSPNTTISPNQVIGTAIVTLPTATQTITAPVAAGGVPLRLQGNPTANANVAEYYNSQVPPQLQARFDSGGRLLSKNVNFVRYANEFPGSDAGAKIAAAIADLPSTGGIVNALGLQGAQSIGSALAIGGTSKPVTVLTGASTFTLSAGSGITVNAASGIQGNGSTAFVAASGANLTTLINLQGNGAFVRGVQVDGNKAQQSAGQGIGIAATGTSWAIVEDNHIKNTYGAGIKLFQTSHTKVAHNVIESPAAATGANSAGILWNQSTNDLIEGNTVLNSVGHGIVGDTTAGVSSGTTIIANHITGTASGQVGIGIGQAALRFTVQENFISGGANGIDMAQSNESVISGNTITGCGQDGIVFDTISSATTNVGNRNTVTGNVISLCGNNGIIFANAYALTSTGINSGNTISANTIYKNGFNGIQLLDWSDGIISGNTIFDNNTINNSEGHGIEFLRTSSSTPRIRNVVISGNRIFKRDSASFQQQSIRLMGAAGDFADIFIGNNELLPSNSGLAINAPTFATLYKWGNQESSGQLDSGGAGLGPVNAYLRNLTVATNDGSVQSSALVNSAPDQTLQLAAPYNGGDALVQSAYGLDLVTVGDNNILFKTADTTRMILDSDGKLGIGNTPATALDVTGPIRSTLTTLTFSATPAFDASLGNSFKLTLTANVTSSTLSNGQAGEPITLLLCQDSTGARTMSWPANLKLSGGAFTLTTTANKCDALTALYDGSNWYETSRSATE